MNLMSAADVIKKLDFEIVVTEHARKRARERFPGFKTARIIDEVRAAIVAGRISPQKPRWTEGRSFSSALYCWEPTEQRCYVLKASRWRFLVLTSVAPKVALLASPRPTKGEVK